MKHLNNTSHVIFSKCNIWNSKSQKLHVKLKEYCNWSIFRAHFVFRSNRLTYWHLHCMGTGSVVCVVYVVCEFVSMWCVCMPGWVCKCVHVMSVGGFASVCMWYLGGFANVCIWYQWVGLQMCACGVSGWVCKWVHVVPGWVCKCVHVVSLGGFASVCLCGFASVCLWCLWVVCKCVHVVSVVGYASMCIWCLWVGLQVCACDVCGWVCKCVNVVSVDGSASVCMCCVHVCGWVGGLVTSDSIFSPASFSCLYFFPSVTKTNIQCLTLQFTCFKQV